ncbi:MAG: Branched-chain amino acid transport system / permease component [Synergistetes bacterium ADurb.Bin155]|jgi:simple sugar transport system permease protein|nr:ABC transporter permease [Synergistales bacterium]OQB44694.1 MAG: Branched-chain amino acid transport system / permease component [Synergistetes bacterium ADurb.Bin155]MBP8996635.1 ABC transporter permease [Synergistales bacterium]HOC81962.1 ABC transporter permease [Synergistales bacterium]HPK42823.1 ABC transporter permease [Synergistales bacterium]
MNKKVDLLKHYLIQNAVPILFIVVSAFAIPISQFSGTYLVQEMLVRLSRNSFLVLSLLIPIMAGMGLNFGMVLGAMAGQIGLIFMSDWSVVGVPGVILAAIISTPLAIALGWLTGTILNLAKGREMVTSFILGFFMNGVYQLVVLYGFGSVVPMTNPAMVLSRGFGIRNVTNLEGIRKCLDNLMPLNIHGIDIPLATFLIIGLFCLFVLWFRGTKLGQDMRAVGQDMKVAGDAGIPVERTRLIAIIISTVLACYGQIIFLQNIGTMNTYNSHEQAGMFAIASLLVGGASVSRASIFNVFLGVVLFHLMFVVSPMAGKYLIGEAQLGEYFRVFVSYGIISLALVLHAWRRQKDRERARRSLRGAVEE